MTVALPSTPRRSKRFQPNVFSTGSHLLQDFCRDAWNTHPLHTRESIGDDLLDDEELNIDHPSQTTFYNDFLRKRRPRKRSSNVASKGNDADDEVFKVGDTVYIATNVRKPSIGILVAIWGVTGLSAEEEDDDGQKVRVRVHWFLRPSELAKLRAEREFCDNEIYLSIDSTAVLSSSAILSHCSVSGTPPVDEASKSLSLSSSKRRRISSSRKAESSKSDDAFYCGHAVNSRLGVFYAIDWKDHRNRALAMSPEIGALAEWGSAQAWVVPVQRISLQPLDSLAEEDEGASDGEYKERPEDTVHSRHRHSPEEGVYAVPKTPSKKRKRTTITPHSAPSKSGSALAEPTPHSKRALRERARKAHAPAIRPPQPELVGKAERLPTDPWLRAMHILHVAARPEALPCRDEEYQRVMRAVEELIDEGSGGCVYISGVPGTGKTATVHAVVRELKRMAEQNETNPFTYVEINGLRIPEPAAAYGVLWEAVSGHDVAEEGHLKIGPKEALKSLTRHFGGRKGPGGHACVVLMDELDQLMTIKQDVVYNFFNWPTLVNSKLVVVAVANTMDLPERVMSGRVRSRLGMIRINFQPYTTPQLEKIVRARLDSAKEGLKGNIPDVLSPDGIKFAAMKVSSISGDARRVLDICRRTVELVQPLKRTARTEDVKEVIKVMQNSPTAAYLRDCSLHERLMLAALLKCMRKEGVEEIKWADVQHQHYLYLGVLAGDGDSSRSPTSGELGCVLDSLLASRAVLIEEGFAALRKSDGERRLILNLEQGEVERVLGEVGGQSWKNALNVS